MTKEEQVLLVKAIINGSTCYACCAKELEYITNYLKLDVEIIKKHYDHKYRYHGIKYENLIG